MHSFGALPDGFILTGNSHWATRNSDLDARCTLAQLQVTDGARRAYQRRKELEADQDHWLGQNPQKANETEQTKSQKPFVPYVLSAGWSEEAKELIRKAKEQGLIGRKPHEPVMIYMCEACKQTKKIGLFDPRSGRFVDEQGT